MYYKQYSTLANSLRTWLLNFGLSINAILSLFNCKYVSVSDFVWFTNCSICSLTWDLWEEERRGVLIGIIMLVLQVASSTIHFFYFLRVLSIFYFCNFWAAHWTFCGTVSVVFVSCLRGIRSSTLLAGFVRFDLCDMWKLSAAALLTLYLRKNTRPLHMHERNPQKKIVAENATFYAFVTVCISSLLPPQLIIRSKN